MTQEPAYYNVPSGEEFPAAGLPGGSVPTFTEAPAVIFTQLFGLKNGQVVQFNLTVRANSAPEAVDQLMDGIRHAGKKWGLSTAKPDISVPAPGALPLDMQPGAGLPGAQAPITVPARPVVSAPALPAASAGAGGGVIHAVKMEIVPLPEGKVTIKWYEAGHQFPDLTSTRPVEKAIELLMPTGGWMASHLAIPGTFQVRHRIEWANGKLNKNGKPYKDIVTLAQE